MVGDIQGRASGGSRSGSGGARPARLGGALRQAWASYRRQLDEELAAAGFGDRGFPDGRVLQLCSGASDVTLSPSPTDGREKIVKPTRHAVAFLAAQREAAARIEARLRTELGPGPVDALYRWLDALGAEDQPRLAEYLRDAASVAGLSE